MAKKRLTPRQKEWETEYSKLKRRVSDWKRKFHAVIDLPQRPERVTKSDIERLKQMRWKNLDEPIKAFARKEFEYSYENKMPEVYTPKPPYKPPTETEFANNTTPDVPQATLEPSDESEEEPDEDGYTETVVSRDEIEAWIEANIESITIDKELDGVREELESLILEAADAYGDYEKYLNYLESKAATLTDLATKAMLGYFNRRTREMEHSYKNAIPEFATVLNLGRPLDVSQSGRLQDEGWVSFDFNDM